MMQNKFMFGITGGSGTGKSTVADIFRSLGYEIIDCDLVARDVTQKGTPCLKELEAEFGSGIIAPDGTLLRRVLGDIVFSDEKKLERLNEITHKHILDEIYRRAKNSKSDMIGIDGAVLFESGVTDRCREVIAVLAPRERRISRIVERDGITAEAAEKRINSQKNDNFYLEKCGIILYNDGNRQELESKVKEVVSKLVVQKHWQDGARKEKQKEMQKDV